MVIASYVPMNRRLLLYIIGATTMGLAICLFIAFFVLEDFRGLFLLIAAPIIWAMNLGYFGFGPVCAVELTESELRWRHLLRGGAAPLSDVRSIRYAKTQTSKGGTAETATVEFTSRKPLKFAASQPGLAEFTDRVREMAPDVTVALPAGN